MEELILKILVYLAPMYFANSSAMLMGGKTRIDFGKTFFDGKPILGKGKTFKGFFFGVGTGTTIAFMISVLLPAESVLVTNDYLLFGFLASLGAIVGDMVASFFKRRNGIKQGEEVLFLDQLDFLIGGMIFGSFIYAPDFFEIIIFALITLIVHKFSNFIAFKIKLKKVPW